jgi:secreted trypsin-like serine protease
MKLAMISMLAAMSLGANASTQSDPQLYIGSDVVPFANHSLQRSEQTQKGDVTPYIIGGSNANPDTYNFHARLVQTYGDYGFGDICGASVINDRFVLTAAHCVMEYSTGEMTLDSSNGGVIVKNFNRTDVYQEEVKRIKNIHVHPLFPTDSFFIGDIAVIELEKPITDNISSMPLATMTDKADYDLVPLGEIIGLGYTDDHYTLPDFLQQNSTQLKTHDECETIIGSSINYDEVICTKGIERTCQGDSGGELLYYKSNGDLQQIGITSYGFFLCEDDNYSVFTEIAYYESWINGLVTHGNTLTFDVNGNNNQYHSFGDNNFVYSERNSSDDTGGDSGSDSSGGSGGGSFGLVSLFLLAAYGVRRRSETAK